MPIYEYQCSGCDRIVEAMVRMGARGPRKCATCAGKLRKIVSRTSFQLKGGGWYAHGSNGCRSHGWTRIRIHCNGSSQAWEMKFGISFNTF